MDLPTLHSARMRVLLTSMASADEPKERIAVGRLAGLALTAPGLMTEAEIAALGDAMACHERGWIVDLRPVSGACIEGARGRHLRGTPPPTLPPKRPTVDQGTMEVDGWMGD